MATTKITNPELFDLASLNTALQLPSGTTAQRPTSPSTGEWRYNTTTNLVEYYDGGAWRDLQSENIPPVASENFATVTWTGDGTASRAITGVGFQPDWVWYKTRTQAYDHNAVDSTRGATNQLRPNTNGFGYSAADQILSFDSDGFTIGSGGDANQNGEDYVAWCWKAKGGTTTSNGEGSVTSTVQANTEAGFSIVKWTSPGSGSSYTVGHGLNSVPEVIIFKYLGITSNWNTYTAPTTASNLLFLDLSNGQTASSDFPTATPTSSTFAMGSSSIGGYDMIAYCFHSVAKYSSIGSYTGNGSSTNGPTITTGFEPAMIIIKRTDSAEDWKIIDNKRGVFANSLEPNEAIAEEAGNNAGFTPLSTGFQIGDTSGDYNANGGTYFYMAFASDVSTPVLASSFNIETYNGNGSTQSITNLGFAPGWVWGKRRSAAEDNAWFDILRGAERQVTSNKTNAQNATTNAIKSFDSDGWTTGANNALNTSGQTYVAWNWKADSAGTINNDGSRESIVNVNQAAGLSLVKFTGDGNTATIGHGLGKVPELIFVKTMSAVSDWPVYSSGLTSAAYRLVLNSTAAQNTTNDEWNSTDPTSTVFSVGSGGNVSANGAQFIAYCFTSITGFCKIGTYTGNGTTLGVTGLGFSPDCVITKPINLTEVWSIFDSARGPNRRLTPSGDDVEYLNSGGGYLQSFDSDGFTVQAGASGSANVNNSGQIYLYAAWKANPTHGGVSAGKMAYLVVAGGGSGGWNSSTWDGAGGGGGVITSYGDESGGSSPVEPSLTLASGTYTITIGAGGFSNSGAVSVNGNNSTITGNATITAIGGGGGGDVTTSPLGSGRDGGSGGGGSNYSGNPLGGSGEPAQGYQGGQGSSSNGGGGGGAGKPGLSDGTGGDGIYCSITGTATYYAGGAAGFNGTGTAGQGGGGTPASAPGGVNTGGGGAGTRSATSADGGSGIVILRLKTSEYSGTVTGSPTVTTDGDETILKYTGSGTYVH